MSSLQSGLNLRLTIIFAVIIVWYLQAKSFLEDFLDLSWHLRKS